MDGKIPAGERERRGVLTTVACWLVLAAILLGLFRLTSLGAQATPTLEASSSPEAVVSLWRPPGSPTHRLVAARIGSEDELFLLDTGAVPTTVQPDQGFRRPLRGGESKRFSATGVRPVLVQTVVLESLTLGHVRRRDFAVDIGEFNLLGADFLQGLSLFIDPAAGRGILRSPGAPG